MQGLFLLTPLCNLSRLPFKGTIEMINGFPPIADVNATILILGSMPSVTSIQRWEYYGNKSNDFWPIISSVFDVEFFTYQDKIDAAIFHRIAIWDVFASCNREQSKDHTITDETFNDFSSFFITHPHITKIIANGKKAHKSLLSIQDSLPSIEIFLAVSTSRAYPLPFEKKLALWRDVLT